MQFTELDLHPDLQRGIDDLGFTTCTDVQADTFTHTLHGRDVTVQSQTGSGKTAAFLISIFQLMNSDDRYRDTRALIVAPTRELAVQIENDAKALGKYLSQKTGCFYGGVGYGKQEQALADRVQLVIGTPGRLIDFNQSGKLDFREMGMIVIDEADRLFDMGFYPDIRKIMRRARPRTERITMLYSATLSTNVRNISYQFMNEPQEIEIQPEHLTVETVEQELYHVAKDEKFSLLLGVLKKEQPTNSIIFCNTKRATEIVAKKLQHNGYECEFIIGDLPQKKRLAIIDRIKGGKINMLTATDVAARGLHVDDLDLVVNYDIPEDPEAYVHRIGRTARAGKEGKAVSLACERFVFGLEAIEDLIGMKIPTATISEDLLLSDESAGRSLGLSHRDDRPPRRQHDRRGGGRPHDRHGTGSGAARSHDNRGPRGDRLARAHGGTSRKPRPDQRPRGGERPARDKVAMDKGPSRESSVEDRLAYYEKKYGEGFGAGKSREAAGSSRGNSGSGGSRAAGQRRSGGGGSKRPRSTPGTDSSRTEPQSGRKQESVQKTQAPESTPKKPKKKGLLARLRERLGRE